MPADAAPDRSESFEVYAWVVLAYSLLVILWGAVVRATGSGAGCGEHWPLCQGVVIPHGAEIATLIEFAHRASSGVAVVLVVGLVYFGFRRFPGGHPVRRLGVAALCLTLTEGLIGAALVLFGWTGNNSSLGRFAALAIHLTNTFLLLASLALTARAAAATEESSVDSPHNGRVGRTGALNSRIRLIYGAALVGTLLLAITGTLAALADTLFPVASFSQGLSNDLSAGSNYLVRLRVIHPVLAVIVGALLLAIAFAALSGRNPRAVRRVAGWLMGLVIVQAALGALNLMLLAPVPVQVLHLLAADLIWVALVLLAAGVQPRREQVVARTSESRSSLAPVALGKPVAPFESRRS
jgi:heme a synthase